MFYKEKEFYVSLACALVAVVAFGVICYSLMGGTEDGTGDSQMVAEATTEPEVTASPEVKETDSKPVESEDSTEDVDDEEEEEDTDDEEEADTEEENETAETAAKPAEATRKFSQEKGILWPVEGEVILGYSPEKVVFFKTLEQYKVNPAIVIASKEGTDVKAGADGVVQEIFTSDETGRSVTVDIGSNFTMTYGQLQKISVAKGDAVKEGQVIGQVAAPTKYFAVEGANLYLQIKEKGNPVNPMDLLR